MKLAQKEKRLLKAAFESCQALKALDTLLVDLRSSDTYTDWVFIVSGTNDRQIRAIADRVVETIFDDCQLNPLGVEGFDGAQWILVDYGSLVCHIFLDEVRENYHLEDMWPRVRPLREDDISALLIPSRTRKPKVPAKETVRRKHAIRKR